MTMTRKLVMLGLLTAALLSSACGFACGFVGDADKLMQEQFNPRVMLAKYEWFKDASAALDKKTADIRVYDSKLKGLQDYYAGVPRQQWPRDDREQMNIWGSELAGIKASYNSLAAEYNSAMSKINYAFTNVGMLPPGATTPLPREYKPYVEN